MSCSSLSASNLIWRKLKQSFTYIVCCQKLNMVHNGQWSTGRCYSRSDDCSAWIYNSHTHFIVPAAFLGVHSVPFDIPPLLLHKKSRPNFHFVLTYNLLAMSNI